VGVDLYEAAEQISALDPDMNRLLDLGDRVKIAGHAVTYLEGVIHL